MLQQIALAVTQLLLTPAFANSTRDYKELNQTQKQVQNNFCQNSFQKYILVLDLVLHRIELAYIKSSHFVWSTVNPDQFDLNKEISK